MQDASFLCMFFLLLFKVLSPTRMKVVNLKQAILQAWKERWSDYQWAINIKKNFPKGATWDYLNFAGFYAHLTLNWSIYWRCLLGFKCSVCVSEALMEQAMIGPSPNPLILSYLKYAISSQVEEKMFYNWAWC